MMQAKNIPLSKIQPNTGQVEGLPKNPRTLRDERFAALKKSIEDDPEMLDLRELLVYPIEGGKYVVIGGNMRLRVLQDLKAKDAPCKVIPKDTPVAKLKAYATKDNVGFGEWDWDALANEWDAGQLKDWGMELPVDFGAAPGGGLTDPDDVPEPPKVPVTQPGDVWVMGRHRILCASSSAEHAHKFFGKPDLVLTDPPYCSGGFQEGGKAQGSVGTDAPHKQIANDRLSTRGYQNLMREAVFAIPAKAFYVFTDWRMWIPLFDMAEAAGAGVRSMIVWNKGTPGMGRGWRAQHELVMWANRETPEFPHKFGGYGNVIDQKRTGNTLHTTQKPVEVIEALLDGMPASLTVCDPFAGSGTTVIACETKGRVCLCAELDAAYVDVAVKRWQDFTGAKAIHEATGKTFDELAAALNNPVPTP